MLMLVKCNAFFYPNGDVEYILCGQNINKDLFGNNSGYKGGSKKEENIMDAAAIYLTFLIQKF